MVMSTLMAAVGQRLGLSTFKTVEGSFEKLGKSFHDLRARTLEGQDVDFARFKGQVVLVTNVACECGFTASNYQQLNELYDKYQGKLEIVAFPSNEFGGQESRDPQGIRKFVDGLGVKFMMMEKTTVNGPNAHPVYLAMKEACGTDEDVKWNFETKFLVSKDGTRINRYTKAMNPKDLVPEIDRMLGENAPKL